MLSRLICRKCKCKEWDWTLHIDLITVRHVYETEWRKFIIWLNWVELFALPGSDGGSGISASCKLKCFALTFREIKATRQQKGIKSFMLIYFGFYFKILWCVLCVLSFLAVNLNFNWTKCKAELFFIFFINIFIFMHTLSETVRFKTGKIAKSSLKITK
jgi:hypothetical protein